MAYFRHVSRNEKSKVTIQLASLASAGNSPEVTEAVESYLAKERSAGQRSIQQGIWRMEEKARRAEKRNFDCPREFAEQRQSLGLLFCFSSFGSSCFGLKLDESDNNEHGFLSSTFPLSAGSFLDLMTFLSAARRYNQTNPGCSLVRLYCSIEDLGDDLLEYFLSAFEELGPPSQVMPLTSRGASYY